MKIRIIIVVLLFVVAVNALVAGYSFMSDPSGTGLKVPLTVLRFSFFKDFFIPGLILFMVNGIFNILTALALTLNYRYSNYLLITQGMLLLGWIIIQVFILREFNLLHFIFIGLGVFFCIGGIYLHKKP